MINYSWSRTLSSFRDYFIWFCCKFFTKSKRLSFSRRSNYDIMV